MIKRLLLIAIILGMAVAAQAQKRVVVYDKETKVPVPKARVRVDRNRLSVCKLTGNVLTHNFFCACCARQKNPWH